MTDYKTIFIFVCLFLTLRLSAQSFDGDGTKANPYKITTEEQLRDLSTKVNKGMSYSGEYFELQNDIVFSKSESFTPIGKTSAKSFRGCFDGKNHTLSGIRIDEETDNVGFFGYVVDGRIKNVCFENVVVKSTKNNAGIVVGYYQNNNNSEERYIESCRIKNSSITISGQSAGGIVGYVYVESGGENLSLKNNIVSGLTVTTKEYGAGICGQIYSIKLPTDGCEVNNLNITLTSASPAFMGLIFGNDNGYYDNYKKKLLYTKRWNLIGRVGDKIGNLASNTEKNDIAAVQFDYQTAGEGGNKWNENDYLLSKDAMQEYAGYFVWPFDKDVDGNDLSNSLTVVEPEYLSASEVILPVLTNNGNTMSYSGSGGNSMTAHWFALGNPFDVSIRVKDIVKHIDTVQGGLVYVYNPVSGIWNNRRSEDDAEVLPGQGFMVAGKSNTISGKLVRPSTKKSAIKQVKAKPIKITCHTANADKEMGLIIDSSADNGFDSKDAFVLFSDGNENLVEPYWLVDGRQVMFNNIKALPYECQASFHANKASLCRLVTENPYNDVVVILVDMLDNTETVLDSVPLNILLDKGENADRFVFKVCRTGNVSLSSIDDQSDIAIYTLGKQINIHAQANGYFRITDLSGRVAECGNLSANKPYHKSLPQGVYLVTAVCGNNVKNQKIIIP